MLASRGCLFNFPSAAFDQFMQYDRSLAQVRSPAMSLLKCESLYQTMVLVLYLQMTTLPPHPRTTSLDGRNLMAWRGGGLGWKYWLEDPPPGGRFRADPIGDWIAHGLMCVYLGSKLKSVSLRS